MVSKLFQVFERTIFLSGAIFRQAVAELSEGEKATALPEISSKHHNS